MSRTSSRRWITAFAMAPLMALAALSFSPIARADAAVDWNTIAIDTISSASPARPGPVGFLDMAVVQVAVYDAVQAIGGKYKPIA